MIGNRTRLAAALAGAALAAGCGSSAGDGNATSGATSTPTPEPAAQPTFTPGSFGPPGRGANQWLPLEPGTQWVRDGGTDVGHRRVPHRVISTVTDVTKEIAGVPAVAVLDQDVDAGQIAQQSLDFFAEDEQGNVWDVGSYTEAYEGGRFVSARDAWLAGVKGGKAGVLIQADPKPGTPAYSIAKPPGEAGDVAQVVESGQSQCVPFKCFKDVLVIREGKASAPDNEFKYYAPGVGQILNTPRKDSQHHDVEKLVNVRRLSGQGLAELSREALKLDRHARTVRRPVFGNSHAAKRTL